MRVLLYCFVLFISGFISGLEVDHFHRVPAHHQTPVDVVSAVPVPEVTTRPSPSPAAQRHRAVSPPKQVRLKPWVLWANTRDAIRVANCESGDHKVGDVSTHYNGDIHQSNGRYFGKWQMGLREWRGTGGSGNPAAASESEQDMRAWRLYKARGWQPWTCSRIMHVN